jgi:hypothetical protein
MRQLFRLLVTGSRTWDDVRTIEQGLAVILDRRRRALGHGCPVMSLPNCLLDLVRRLVSGFESSF